MVAIKILNGGGFVLTAFVTKKINYERVNK